MKRVLLVSVAAALLSTAAGCGGGSTAKTEPTISASSHSTVSSSPESSATPTSSATSDRMNLDTDPSLALPARWWLWSESFDPAANPIDDQTGAVCGQNQPDDVWFLAGTHGGPADRSCRIPSARPVYFPVLNLICTVLTGETVQQALDGCHSRVDSARASLDGQPLTPAVASSDDAFTFIAQPASSTGLDAGRHSVVSWGVWVGPVTVTSGQHVLTFTGKSGSFTTSVTYHLTVGAGL